MGKWAPDRHSFPNWYLRMVQPRYLAWDRKGNQDWISAEHNSILPHKLKMLKIWNFTSTLKFHFIVFDAMLCDTLEWLQYFFFLIPVVTDIPIAGKFSWETSAIFNRHSSEYHSCIDLLNIQI